MIKNRMLATGLAGLLTLACGSAYAGCTYPEQVTAVPDGKSATKEEMIAAQRVVKTYVADMEQYMACLDTEFEAMGEEATDEHRLIRDKRHNAAIDAMDKVAGDFNLAVREFKARD